jgi:hypothetical protein
MGVNFCVYVNKVSLLASVWVCAFCHMNISEFVWRIWIKN